MNMIKGLGSVLGLTGVLILGGCETQRNQPTQSNQPYQSSGYGTTSQPTVYSGYGVVQSIELMQQDSTGSSIGLGTIAGAVVGGVAGSQIGSGRGTIAATVIGAAGGAYIGHELENRQSQGPEIYRFSVRMDNGSYQSLMLEGNPGFRVGDRVRINNGVMQRY